MAAYIAIILSSIAIILMIVILIRFKKLFSTESIIEKTQNQINRVITDVNNHTNRDIELINEATKRTRLLLKDVEKEQENFKEASQRLRDMIAIAEQSNNRNISKSFLYNTPSKTNKTINENQSFEVKKETVQPTLFDEEPKSQILKDETKVTSDGAAYKEVPLLITKIYDDKTVEQKKSSKSLSERVEKLFREGLDVETIALELSCSISEVQFIIDML